MSDIHPVLDLIDGAIDAWETSDDAMRWTPETELRAEANPVHGGELTHERIARIYGVDPHLVVPYEVRVWTAEETRRFVSAVSPGLRITPWQQAVLESFPLGPIDVRLSTSRRRVDRLIDGLGESIQRYWADECANATKREQMRYLHMSYRAKTRNRNRRTR